MLTLQASKPRQRYHEKTCIKVPTYNNIKYIFKLSLQMSSTLVVGLQHVAHAAALHCPQKAFLIIYLFIHFTLKLIVLSLWDFYRKFSLLSQRKASCDSHSTRPTVYAGCFSVSIIHWPLTWTTGSLTCTQMLMHAVAQRGVWKLTLGEKSFAASGNRSCLCDVPVQRPNTWATSPPFHSKPLLLHLHILQKACGHSAAIAESAGSCCYILFHSV